MKNTQETNKQEKNTPLYYRIFDLMQVTDSIKQFKAACKARWEDFTGRRTVCSDISEQVSEMPAQAALVESLITAPTAELAAQPAAVTTGIDYNDLLKFKCASEQEFVIVGYTEPQGSRSGFGSLLVGYYREDKLVYAGKVGTGFTSETLETLSAQLRDMRVEYCPLIEYSENNNSTVYWVRPEIKVDLKFAEWTESGKLRMPRFKAIRNS